MCKVFPWASVQAGPTYWNISIYCRQLSGAVIALFGVMSLTLLALFLQFPAIAGNLNWNLIVKAISASPETAAPTAAETDPSSIAPPDSEVSASTDAEGRAGETLIINTSPPAEDSCAAAIYPSTPRVEGRSQEPPRRKWLALSIAEHSAATFDAWSTRRSISTGQYEELNPTLRPFARNSSIYAAIQYGRVARKRLVQHGSLTRCAFPKCHLVSSPKNRLAPRLVAPIGLHPANKNT